MSLSYSIKDVMLRNIVIKSGVCKKTNEFWFHLTAKIRLTTAAGIWVMMKPTFFSSVKFGTGRQLNILCLRGGLCF